mmetsp:Transcript_47114/g.121765  ORF Transcript_47114/g.121765 Transcript_47114/m.121765 type:complete len:96 (-) Transcript_47114:1005-1292(-)
MITSSAFFRHSYSHTCMQICTLSHNDGIPPPHPPTHPRFCLFIFAWPYLIKAAIELDESEVKRRERSEKKGKNKREEEREGEGGQSGSGRVHVWG